MKTPKLTHLMVLLVIAVAPFLFPAPAEALAPSSPWIAITGKYTYQGGYGDYTFVEISINFCGGFMGGNDQGPPTPISGDSSKFGWIIQSITAKFTISGTATEETITVSSDYCGTAKTNKVSTCGNFSIPKRVPQARRIPISFKGPGNITSTSIYFKELKYSLPVRLNHYDWGSGIWYGYLNTTYLPLGKHHGHVTTFVDGVRGGGCATGGFKVVDK